MDTNDNQEEQEKSMKELLPRPIKSVSLDAIEAAFSKALLELTQREYDVDVQQFTLRPEGSNWSSDESSMTIKITKKTYLGRGSLFSTPDE